MSNSLLEATKSGVENIILENVISEQLSNSNLSMGVPISEHSCISENSEDYWSDLDDYSELDHYYESRADTRLPRQGHDLKHGKVIQKRGSNQEKFISNRAKTLVKYGKHHFNVSADDIDTAAKAIIRDFVERQGYFEAIDINQTILSGERSILVHVPGRLDTKTGEREEYLIKVYRIQYGVNRGHEWGLKEYRNAYAMRKYANVPNVYCPTKNITIIHLVGDDGIPAPNLNEVTFEITEKIYDDVVATMLKWYSDGKIVHGKLSARTMLWWKDKIWFISFSHAVRTSEPNALQMLMKDCCHITHFFKSKGLLKVKSIMNLFKFITGLEKIDNDVLHVLRNTRKQVKHKQKRRLHQEGE